MVCDDPWWVCFCVRESEDQRLNKWLWWKERMVTMEMLCDLALWQRQHACEDWMGLKVWVVKWDAMAHIGTFYRTQIPVSGEIQWSEGMWWHENWKILWSITLWGMDEVDQRGPGVWRFRHRHLSGTSHALLGGGGVHGPTVFKCNDSFCFVVCCSCVRMVIRQFFCLFVKNLHISLHCT